MTPEVFISFLLASTLLIIIPGPTVITIMSHSIADGNCQSLKTILGATLAHSIYIGITSFGINEIIMLSLKYFIIIKWIGVTYLVYSGLKKILIAKKNALLPAESSLKKKKGGSYFLQGFAVTISNPKAIVFYGVFFPPFLNPTASLLPQYLILGITFITVFIALSVLSAYFASKLSGFLASKNKWLVDRVSGLMMILAGCILATVKSSK